MQNAEWFALGFQVRVLAKVMSQISIRNQEKNLQSHGIRLTELQHSTLRLLERRSSTSSEISRRLHIDPATIVPVIDALERNGYVLRGKDPQDRRRNPLSLTPAGRDLLAHLPLLFDEDVVISALQQLGEEKSHTLLALLREMVTQMSGDDVISGEIAANSEQVRQAFRARVNQPLADPPA